jgi:hypothetical protein
MAQTQSSAPLVLTNANLQAACDAWGRTPTAGGGSMGLSSWLSKSHPHYSVEQYAYLIQRVRAEIGDNTDYSTFEDPRTVPTQE